MNAALRIVLLAGLLLVIDLPWLYGSSDWSGRMIKEIQGSALKLKWEPAIVVYLAMAYLVTVASSWKEAAAIGVATYATYDFTNLATLKDYDPAFAVADSLWGGALFGTARAVAEYFKLV